MTSRKTKVRLRSGSGFTLVEAAIVLVVLGLIALIGFPKISSAMVKSDLRSARTTVVNLVATARAASVQTGQRTWIMFQGGNAYVITSAGDTVGSVQHLDTLYGVTVSGVGSIAFDPRGFGASLGDTSSVVLSRNSYYETVKLDGLGRVIK